MLAMTKFMSAVEIFAPSSQATGGGRGTKRGRRRAQLITGERGEREREERREPRQQIERLRSSFKEDFKAPNPRPLCLWM